MIDPGEGYRLLASDEVIRCGDEISTSRGWIASGLIGFPARATGYHVRRSTNNTLDDSIVRLRYAMQRPDWAAALLGELPQQLRDDIAMVLTHFVGDKP